MENTEEETKKKKALPQNTEALLDELDSESRAQGDEELNADELLKSIDPNIEASFKDLTSDFSNVSEEIQSLNLDGDYRVDETVPIKQRIKIRFRKIQKYVWNQLVSLAYLIKYFFIWLFTDGLKKILSLLKVFFGYFGSILKTFFGWSAKKKVLFIITTGVLGSLTFGFLFVVRHKLLYRESHKFIGSISEIAAYSFKYDPDSQLESFYTSPRVKTYSYQLKPIIVNLKRRNSSQRNPMGFFEFVLDGSSGDVLVEVKTRESEIVDIMQRVVEDMWYEELDTVEGKSLLKETLRKELNKVLVDGALRKVQIQSVIIKP